jgi:hypothetical protein
MNSLHSLSSTQTPSTSLVDTRTFLALPSISPVDFSLRVLSSSAGAKSYSSNKLFNNMVDYLKILPTDLDNIHNDYNFNNLVGFDVYRKSV